MWKSPCSTLRLGGDEIIIMRYFLPILLMVWPYLPIGIFCIRNEEVMSSVFLIYVLLTVVVYLANAVNAFSMQDIKRSALFEMLLKLIHIPFYLVVFIVGLLFVGASVVPALIFVTPLLVFVLFIIDWFLMLTTSMYGINAMIRAGRERKISTKFAIVNILLHLFFVTDMISSVVVYCKLRKAAE